MAHHQFGDFCTQLLGILCTSKNNSPDYSSLAALAVCTPRTYVKYESSGLHAICDACVVLLLLLFVGERL